MKDMSNSNDIYWTIEQEEQEEIVVKASRFIGHAFSVDSKNKADGILEVIRKHHHAARHHCFAYVIGAKGLEFRYSDDGEPSGTGGKPILFMINKFNLKDIIVVVTRYFGGTKLGVGGLARAYSSAAEAVLNKCKTKPLYITKKIKTFCGYEDFQAVKSLYEKYTVNNTEEYKDSISIISDVPVSLVEEFIEQVTNLTNGRAGCINLDLT